MFAYQLCAKLESTFLSPCLLFYGQVFILVNFRFKWSLFKTLEFLNSRKEDVEL